MLSRSSARASVAAFAFLTAHAAGAATIGLVAPTNAGPAPLAKVKGESIEASEDAGKLVIRKVGTPLADRADADHTQCAVRQP